ncbi:MAG: hypothetical protein EOO10_10950 [Chitinophagaceae bacterium]|nr:MAG: hypothetical protein EOO10_10950 [Chitinophagaceae bacterium]
MAKILGLDLGTNSIGWAIRDTSAHENQIIDKGVLTFEKGVAEGKSGEFPMVQKRTESRGKRRNYQAEKYRKWQLLQTLIENGMCPLTIEQLNEWRHYKKGVGRKYPQSEVFIQWLRFDFDGDGKPDFERFGFSKHESLYVFRMLASSSDEQSRKIFQDNPQILGRVLYQLVQRRGFRGRDEEESKTIMEGGGDRGAKGVKEISPYLERYGTLGAALYHLQKETGQRIRKRYNLRSDYEQELKTISESHGFGEDLYKRLWKAIVWQRPLRSQKGLVGICTFERGKSRAPVSHPLYEEYRTWVFINNLTIVLPKGVNEEEYLDRTIYPLFYNASRDFKLKKLRDRLKKDGGDITARFYDDTKVISCTLLNEFQKLLGADWKEKYGWYKALNNEPQESGYSFEDIWHVLATFDSKEKLKEFALQKLGLSEDGAEAFSKIKLQQGYATLSLAAIKKLLPYLKKGFKYSHAVYLANMHKVLGAQKLNDELAAHLAETFGTIEKQMERRRQIDEIVKSLIADHQNAAQRWGMDSGYLLDNDDRNDIERKATALMGEKTWEELPGEEKDAILQSVAASYQTYLQQRINTPLVNIFPKKERLHDAIFTHLQNTYNLPDKARKNLWHPSEQETYAPAKEVDGRKVLGDPQPISRGFKNPMALKTLHQLKKLANYLLQTGKIDEDTRIVVEIARELNDANRRKAIERWQREREKENDEYRKRIQETLAECGVNYEINKELLDKYRLWLEQNRHCLYTGKQIGFCEWFNGNLYDFEHTVPASMSFDNELKNLTLADGLYNKQIKGKRLPTALPNYYEDAVIDGKEYTAIRPRLKFMEEKVAALEKMLDEWVKKTSDEKSIQDAIIQRRHIIRMDLDYWRKKLDTFTIKEYKAGWRNSQLRDTQVITKYALPYLKTVFNKVDVQKGSVTAAFREIYKIQPRTEKKDRTKHSHHSIDAAVLTLIPPAAVREKILIRYNEEKDSNPHNTYHETVRDWKAFRAEHILSIEDDVLINFQPKQRTLTPTYKNVRKRGRQQFVKQKTADGKWQFKLDEGGKQIPLKAKGDSIRGQLHKESFFGAIKLNGEQWLVERYPVAAFTKIEDCKNIVDNAVRKIVEETLKERMAEGLSFDKAKLDPIPFPSGKAVIKKVRCKVAAGRGYLTPAKALEIRQHDFKSKHDYKNAVYAQNDENTLCLYYEGKVDGKTERAFRIVGLFELAQLKLTSVEDIHKEEYYKTIPAGKGKVKANISIDTILMAGTKTLFYKDNIDELKGLEEVDLLKRLFRIYKFNEMGTPNIYLQNHLEARANDQLGDGDTQFDSTKYQYRLKLKADKFSCALEGKHFEVKPDGQIHWL